MNPNSSNPQTSEAQTEGSSGGTEGDVDDVQFDREARLESIMDFDPFPKKEVKDEGDDTLEAGTDDTVSGGTQSGDKRSSPDKPGEKKDGKPPESQQSTTPQQPETPNEVTLLRQQLAEMRNALDDMRRQAVAPQAQQSPQGQPQGDVQQQQQELLNRYALNIPPQLMEAVRGEDPNQAMGATQLLLASLGARVHQNVMDEIRRAVPAYVQQTVRSTTSARETAKTVKEDFYGTYPELNHQTLYGIVAQTSAEVAQQLGLNQWSPVLRDETAKAVKTKLTAIGWNFDQPAGQQEPPANTPAPRTRPPRMVGGKTRQPAQTPAERLNTREDIHDTLFGPS